MGWLLEDFINNLKSKKLFFIVTVIFLGFLAYSNTFASPFVFDDIGNVFGNDALRNWHLFVNWWSPTRPRFIGNLTFFLNYQIGTTNVAVYHITNLVIHLATTIALWLLIKILFKTKKLQETKIARQQDLIAAFTALIFLVHPIQTQAVTYIVQRFTELSALFYILTIYFYACARQTKKLFFLALAAITTLLAFLTKENSFTLPVAVLAVEIYFFSGFKKIVRPKFIAITLAFVALSAFTIYKLISIPDTFGPKTTFAGESITKTNYLISQIGILPKYVQLLIIPISQSVDHYARVIENIENSFVLVGIIIVLGLITTAIATYRKYPLISFSISWFLITMSAESSFIPIQDLMVEHRLYLPMAGVSLFLTVVSYLIFQRLAPKKWPSAMLVLVIILTILTFERNNVWISKVSLWQDAVNKNPENNRAITNLASAYFKNKDLEKAQTYIDKSLAINSKNPDALLLKGAVAGEQKHYDEAITWFNKALAISPKYIGAYSDMAVVYYKQKNYTEAENTYKKILELSPNNIPVYEILSYILTIDGKRAEASDYRAKAIAIDPSSQKDFDKLDKLKLQN